MVSMGFILSGFVFLLEASILELEYLTLRDAQGAEIYETLCEPGQELEVAFKFMRREFPKNAVTHLEIEIYDEKGALTLNQAETRDTVDGGRIEKFHFKVPADARGKYLLVLTIRVKVEDVVYSEVTKTAPFEVSSSLKS